MKTFYSILFLFFSVSFISGQQKGLAPAAKKTSSFSGTTYALIVGISNYEDDGIPDLKYAHKDAEAFAEYLQSDAGGSLGPDNLTLLTNEKATGANIHKALYTMVKNSVEGDNIIIYFSGHGDVETIYEGEPGHLLVYDSPAMIYQINSLRIDDLQRIVKTLSDQKKAKVRVFLDACRSGKLAGSEVNGSQATAASLNNQFANEVKVMSCQPNEFSMEGEEWGGGRGVFSYYMIEGLMGLADTDESESVSLRELERYLEDRFEEESAKIQQTPMILGDKNSLMAIVDPATLDRLYLEKNINGNQAVEEVLVNAKGTEAPTEDSLALFYVAIDQKNLLDEFTANNNSQKSAQFYFEALANSSNFKSKVPIIKGDYIAALQNDAQHAINQYLTIDQSEMNNRWNENNSEYDRYAKYLSQAAKLMGETHYMFPQLKAKEIYFTVVARRLEEQKKKKEDQDYNVLISDIENAIVFQPRSPFLFNELGLLYQNQKNYDNANLQFEKAIEMSPTWALPVCNIASSYLKMKKYDLAIKWANNAKSIDSNYVAIYRILTMSYYWLGDYQKSLDFELQELKLAPNCRILANLGIKYFKLNDYVKAREYVAKALECDPTELRPHWTLGDILKSEGKYEQAISEYKILENDETIQKGIWRQLAVCYNKLGDLKTAIKYYEKIIALEPNHEIRKYLAELMLLNNQVEEAKAHHEYSISNIDADYMYSYFDLACIAVINNDLNGFKSNMKLAISKGFDSKKEMEESNCLSSIKSTVEYIEILNLLN